MISMTTGITVARVQTFCFSALLPECRRLADEWIAARYKEVDQ